MTTTEVNLNLGFTSQDYIKMSPSSLLRCRGGYAVFRALWLTWNKIVFSSAKLQIPLHIRKLKKKYNFGDSEWKMHKTKKTFSIRWICLHESCSFSQFPFAPSTIFHIIFSPYWDFCISSVQMLKQLKESFYHLFYNSCYPNLLSNDFIPKYIKPGTSTHLMKQSHLCHIEFIRLLAFYHLAFSLIQHQNIGYLITAPESNPPFHSSCLSLKHLPLKILACWYLLIFAIILLEIQHRDDQWKWC